MELRQKNPPTRLLAAFTLLAWLGMVVHNAVELPDMPFFQPEYLFPSLLSLFLFLGWWKQPNRRRLWSGLLLGWAGLHLFFGALLSVIPLSIWPFTPEQSLRHYSAHIVYGLTQFPLIWILWKEVSG